MEKYGRFPCDSCWLSQGYSAKHKAVDLGFLTKYGANLPVGAWKSGVVVATGTDSAGGVYVVLQHDHEDGSRWITRYWHFVKGSVVVKKGQEVAQGQKLGIRGKTGISTGVHLHFEVWKCPSGYSYKSADINKYAVNPMKHTYIYEGQVVQEKSAIKKPVEKVAEPTELDSLKEENERLNAELEAANKKLEEIKKIVE